MSAAAYIVSVAYLLLVAGGLGAGAWALRGALAPGLTGAAARLAEVVIALTALILVAEVLGVAGALGRLALLIGALAASAALYGAARLLVRRRPAAAVAPPVIPEGVAAPSRARLAPAALAVGTLVVVASAWLSRIRDALSSGMLDYDTLWYHMTFAARFVQDGGLTHVIDVGNAPSSYFPANAELLQAAGILAFGDRDVLGPLVNLAWLALALLAVWCAGRRLGLGPLAVTAVAPVMVLPIMLTGAGSALTDVAALALLLAAFALAFGEDRHPATLAFAGLAAGLAAGTKVTILAPVVALTICVVAIAVRRREYRTIALWALPALLAGGFWYVRDAVFTGSPAPWFRGVPGLPHLSTEPSDCGVTSIAGYPGGLGGIRHDLVPQIPYAFTDWGAPLIAVALGGAAVAAIAGPLRARVAGLTSLASAAVYVVTPATAGGVDGRCFGFNTRALLPALVLGLLALALATRTPLQRLVLAVVASGWTVVLVAGGGHGNPWLWIAAGVVAGVLVAILAGRTTGARRVLAPVLAAALVLAVAAGFVVQRAYVEDRYAGTGAPEDAREIGPQQLDAVAAMTGQRIAVANIHTTYPLLGPELGNRVSFLGLRRSTGDFTYPTTCPAWRVALRRERITLVVIGAPQGAVEPDELAWTLGSGAAAVLEEGDGGWVIRLGGAAGPVRPCAPA